MKPPILYPGGKTAMIKNVLRLLPAHSQYVEPFCGGASIFWAKELASHNVLNDTFSGILNFYRVVRDEEKRKTLIDMIQKSLYHETLYNKCREIIKNGGSDIEEAYSVFICSRLSFGAKLIDGYGFGNTGGHMRAFNRASDFLIENIEKYAEKLRHVEFFSRDALDVIALKNARDTFFYIDPPYIGTESFHYAQYTEDDYKHLLDVLAGIKGKFMLSSFKTDILSEYAEKYGWHQNEYEFNLRITGINGTGRKKIEVLTMNYKDTMLDL